MVSLLVATDCSSPDQRSASGKIKAANAIFLVEENKVNTSAWIVQRRWQYFSNGRECVCVQRRDEEAQMPSHSLVILMQTRVSGRMGVPRAYDAVRSIIDLRYL